MVQATEGVCALRASTVLPESSKGSCGIAYVLAFGRMLAKSPVSEWFRHSSSAHPVMDNGSYPRKSVPPFRYGVVHLALRCVMYIRCWATRALADGSFARAGTERGVQAVEVST